MVKCDELHNFVINLSEIIWKNLRYLEEMIYPIS